jgi:hypothetical protein
MTWTKRTKPTSSYTNRNSGIENYLLIQDGGFLLNQDGSLIVLSNYSQWNKRDYPGITWEILDDTWEECTYTWEELEGTTWTKRTKP